MKNPLLLLSFFIFLSCTEQEDSDVNPEQTKLKVYVNANLVNDSPFVADGDSLVFHYYFQAEDNLKISDDEFAEDFFIEISPLQTEFTLTSDDLSNFHFLYFRHCFCHPKSYTTILSGSVEGAKKTNGSWELNGQLTLESGFIDEQSQDSIFQSTRDLDFLGTFHISDIPSAFLVD